MHSLNMSLSNIKIEQKSVVLIVGAYLDNMIQGVYMSSPDCVPSRRNCVQILLHKCSMYVP